MVSGWNSKKICLFAMLGALMVTVLLSVQGHAQVAGATLTGTVTDPSGAVIPGAKIFIENTATGVVTNSTTNSAGLYTVPNLIPGPYQVTVSAHGFQTSQRKGITLTVGAQQLLNLTMQVGQTTQTVEVTGQAPAVQLATSTISAVVNSTMVRALPLNGRDWTTLAELQPGVLSAAATQLSTSVTSFQRGNRGLGLQLAVSGNRPQLNLYRIDGITVNDYANGGPGSVQGGTLGVDAIQEFSVLTSNYNAEYGRTSGGVINAITRSGTNQFHGDAFEFLRNGSLDAANFFDNFSNVTKPPFRQNQFGGSAGGPIQKDKTFIFGDYEGLRVKTSTTVIADVPSIDARNGILNFPGGPSTFPSGCVATSTPNQCQVTVNPLVEPYLPLWALPNAGLLSPGNTGLYSFPGNQTISENFVTARVDHKISDRDSSFGSFEYDHANQLLPDPVNDVLNPSNTTRVLVVLEETHIFSPRMVNTVRGGYSRSWAQLAELLPVNPAAGDLGLGPATGFGTPAIAVTGLTGVEGAAGAEQYTYPYNSFQGDDDAFLALGKQSLKFGVDVERDQLNSLFVPALAGNFEFGTLADFLQDNPRSIRTALPNLVTGRGWRQTIFGAYVQDDIRWRPNLTFNLGVRYEMATTLTEVQNKEVSLHDVYTDKAPTIGPPLIATNPTLHNFDPRIGFAWDPFRDGKTSIRGGFGVFDALPLLSEVAFKDNQSGPFNAQGNATNLPTGSFPLTAFNLSAASSALRTFYVQQNPSLAYVMTWNLNVQRQLMPNLTASIAYVGSHGVHEPFAVDDMNIVMPTETSAGYLWPFPAGSGTPLNSGGVVSRIDTLQWSNSTSYEALEAQIERRFSHGFQVQGSYTWGKAIDGGDGINIGDPFANSISSLFFFNPKLRRAVSDFDVAQNLVANYTWVVPTPKSFHGPAEWALSGWQLGGIFTLRTGLPFTPNVAGSGNGSSGDPLGLNNSDPFDYPNRLAGPGCQSLVNPGNVNNYLKLNCFGLPMATSAIAAQCTPFSAATAPGTCANLLGNSGRNDVFGPGSVDFDFSVFKNNYIKRISENFNVQFRAEFFNVLNRANFSSPIDNSNIFDVTGAPVAGAGLIDGTSTPAREIQFALKVIW